MLFHQKFDDCCAIINKLYTLQLLQDVTFELHSHAGKIVN